MDLPQVALMWDRVKRFDKIYIYVINIASTVEGFCPLVADCQELGGV